MWTFKSNTYHATFCSYIYHALTASTETNTPPGSLAFYFPDSVGITGTYTVTNVIQSHYPFKIAPGYVYVQLTDSSQNNFWVISGSTTPQVTLTVSASGLATATLPPVMMVNVNTAFPNVAPIGALSGTDSSLVSGTIFQTPLN